jgi:hypothetical protein
VAALDRHAPEGEIAETGIERGIRMAGEVALGCSRLGARREAADGGDAGRCERVALSIWRSEQQRGASVGLEVLRVPGEARDEDDRLAGEIACRLDERGIGRAVFEQGCQTCGSGAADQPARLGAAET